MEPRGPQSGGELVAIGRNSPADTTEPRRLIWAVAELCWADAAGNPIRSRATIVDISISGACIRLKERIGVGSHLTVKWHREQFSATARNCRADGPNYLLGVRREKCSPVVVPAAKTPSQIIVSEQPSSAPPASLADMKNRPVAASAAMLESAPQNIELSNAERRHVKTVEKNPVPSRHFEPRGPVAPQEADRRERNAMQPKGLFPNFWPRHHADDAPLQVAPKETPVNKPIHSVEHVNDAPARLLSYEDIYHAAGIMSPRSGYDIRKVVEMLNSERIRDLSKDIQRASVLMALDAGGASVGELLQDATRRQQALDTYEDGQRKQLEEFELRKAQENAQIEKEMRRITAHYSERIQQNKDEVAAHKEALHSWQMAKQHESQRISEVLELCGKQSAMPAETAALAAAAGVSGLTAVSATTPRAATDDSSKRT